MLQLIYSSSGITNSAIYVDTNYTGSKIKMYLTSSFTGDVTNISADLISAKTAPDGGWILAEINRDQIPTKSGQYIADIYELGEGTGNDTWIEATSAWINETQTWLEYSPGETIGDYLTTERVIVSGSDYDTISKYEFKDKSNFTVYNG